jgi:Protein of unknown function (DUF1566)
MTSSLSTRQRFKPVPIIVGILFALPFSHMALSATVVNPVPKPAYKMPLNDTGIATCSNNSINNFACPVAGFPGQDAQYGRDKKYNNNTDGHAGFSFTKISNTGKALPASAQTWNCVKDNVTHLMWEVKTNDNGLHDMDWTYSWYNPNKKTNGGYAGYQNGGECVNTTSCDTDAYVKAVNKVGWCGYKDWRMPTLMELMGLLSLDRFKPALDQKYFPEYNIGVFWSSSPYANNSTPPGWAWDIDFSEGFVAWGECGVDDEGRQVRLVRSGQ